MIINLLNWLIITFIIFPFGIVTASYFQLSFKKLSFIELILLGLIPVILLSITAGFLIKINIEFFVFNLSLATIILWNKQKIVKNKLIEIKGVWRDAPVGNQIILILFFLITGIQSSMPTNIPDDGYYYLQTVKWVNNFGIQTDVVKYGFQYGQFSSWHIFQAIFNFSSIFVNRLNNINGWILIVFVIFILQKIKSASHDIRIFGLISILSVTAFQYFVTAPSPDLPVILISIVVFYYFLFKDKTPDNFIFVSLLSLTAISIKITSFYLLFIVFSYDWKVIFRSKKLIYAILIVFLLIFIKNLITSGSLLFPLNIQLSNWITTNEISIILQDNYQKIWNLAFGFYNEDISKLPIYEKLEIWLFQLGYKSILNFIWVLGIALVGILSFFTRAKIIFQVFIISVVHFIILWNISPNYRFALPLIFLNYAVILISFNKKFILKKEYIFIVLLFSGIWLTPLIKPILKISNNGIVNINHPVKLEYLLIRAKPFISPNYKKVIFNGEEVYIPPKYHYAWDGPLPCVMRYHYEKYSN